MPPAPNQAARPSWRTFFYPRPRGETIDWREKYAGWAEAGTLFFLAGLAVVLPMAPITAARDIALFGAVFCWLFRSALLARWEMRRTPLDWPLGLLVLVGFLSWPGAVDQTYTGHELIHKLLKSILLYYLAVQTIRTRPRALVVLGALVTGAMVMDIYGLGHRLATGDLNRLVSLQATPTQLGTYLIQTAPFFLLLPLRVKALPTRIGVTLLAGLHVLAIYWNQGRMPAMTFLAQSALIFYFVGIRLRYLLVGVLALGLCLAIFLPREIIVLDENYQGGLRLGPLTIEGIKGTRMAVWAQALRQIEEHPLVGLGYGRRSFNKKYPALTEIESSLWHPHNLFLGLAVEMGLPGLAVFLAMLFALFRTLWPLARSGQGPPDPVMVGTVTMVVGFLLINMTDYQFADEAALLFWLLVGAAISVKTFGNPAPVQATVC